MKDIVLHDEGNYSDPWGIEQEWYAQPGCHLYTGYFANAVQVWSSLQEPEDVSVGTAALAFNCAAEIIKQAVEHHPYMYLSADEGDPLHEHKIEHDGE